MIFNSYIAWGILVDGYVKILEQYLIKNWCKIDYLECWKRKSEIGLIDPEVKD